MTVSIDLAAKYYDDIYEDWAGEKLTKKEIKLISGLVPSGAKILDVGCGTGRHLIPLSQLGYSVTGVDSSLGMLGELESRYPKAEVIHSSVGNMGLGKNSYDLVIIMYNAFLEMVFDAKSAKELLWRLKASITPQGKILLAIRHDERKNHSKSLNFSFRKKKGNKEYIVTWRVLEFDKIDNITECEEKIEVFSVAGKKIDEVVSVVRQRWWKEAEILSLAKAVGLKCVVKRLEGSGHKYYVLQKDGL